jgi:lipoprotein-releasing system ATP-binding protein
MDSIGGATGDPLLSLRGITKSFPSVSGNGDRLVILREVDFDVAAGETMAVVGASGIGKSTLLHIIGTLDRPDSGRLLFNGTDVFGYTDEALAGFRNASIGFVFQFHHLMAEFSALENVMMPALINRQPKPQAREAAGDLLSRMGLRDRRHHRVTDLSGGEQQRVALARALVLKPALLLADEPTGNLDKGNSEAVHELLYELNRELGMTLMVVTHNMELAAYMARRVTLADGQVTEMGPE